MLYTCLAVILFTAGVSGRHPLPLGRHPLSDMPPEKHTPLSLEAHPPGSSPPPGRYTPLEAQHSQKHSTPGKHAAPLPMATAADGTHPTGMLSCSQIPPLVQVVKSQINYVVKQSFIRNHNPPGVKYDWR